MAEDVRDQLTCHSSNQAFVQLEIFQLWKWHLSGLMSFSPRNPMVNYHHKRDLWQGYTGYLLAPGRAYCDKNYPLASTFLESFHPN